MDKRKHSLRGSGKLRQRIARKTKEERVSGMAWQVVSNATVVKDETLPEKCQFLRILVSIVAINYLCLIIFLSFKKKKSQFS